MLLFYQVFVKTSNMFCFGFCGETTVTVWVMSKALVLIWSDVLLADDCRQ